LPYFFIISSIALIFFLKSLYKISSDLFSIAFDSLNLSLGKISINIFAFMSMLFIGAYVFMNTEAIKTLPKMLSSQDEYIKPYVRRLDLADWRLAHSVLESYKDTNDVVISSAGVKAYYYIGRLDYDLNMSVFSEVGGDEFLVDLRTGAKVISSIDSIRAIMKTNESGIIVIEEAHRNNPYAVSEGVTKYIEEQTSKINVKPNSRLFIYEWSR